MGIYSDATGAGELAIISFFSRDGGREQVLLVPQADRKLQEVAAASNETYVYELFAAIAAGFQRLSRLRARKVILFVDSEAA